MVNLPPGVERGVVDHNFLKAQCFRTICSMLALWRLGRNAETACYKRYPSKIKYKIKIIEIHLKNRSHFHMFRVIIDSARTIQKLYCMMLGRLL